MKTIYDHLVNWREAQAAKHDLPSNYAKKDINGLSNYDFLVELSEAIEDRLEKESRAIRDMIGQRSLDQIADYFAVSPRTIARIRDGLTYTHVK